LKINEKLVFETLSVDEALDRLALASWTKERGNDEDGRMYTPLEVLGCLIVRERVKKHMGRLFVQVVAANATERVSMANDKEEKEYREEEAARRITVDAARELGGSVERLGKAFERVWKTTISVEDDELFSERAADQDDDDDEIKALFTALVLYRRAFGANIGHPCDPSSTLLSPPPSPTTKGRGVVKYAQMLHELRKALGNRVFEDDNTNDDVADDAVDMEGVGSVLGLEDARDRVVDMIVDVERREKRSVVVSI
jgi:hypothetical protein